MILNCWCFYVLFHVFSQHFTKFSSEIPEFYTFFLPFFVPTNFLKFLLKKYVFHYYSLKRNKLFSTVLKIFLEHNIKEHWKNIYLSCFRDVKSWHEGLSQMLINCVIRQLIFYFWRIKKCFVIFFFFFKRIICDGIFWEFKMFCKLLQMKSLVQSMVIWLLFFCNMIFIQTTT